MKKNKKIHYELLDHTADIAIKVCGDSIEGLFLNSATALADIITDMADITPESEYEKMELTADNYEDLMIKWLKEILSIWHLDQSIVFPNRILTLTEQTLSAEVSIIPYDAGYRIKNDIKAVTYHQFRLIKTTSGWELKVIFDV